MGKLVCAYMCACTCTHTHMHTQPVKQPGWGLGGTGKGFPSHEGSAFTHATCLPPGYPAAYSTALLLREGPGFSC